MNWNTFFKAGFYGDAIALLAGALLTLAFAPFDITPLAIVSPALLLGTWLYVTKARAFFRGWLFGLGLFSTGVYWVFISIHTFGEASLFLSSFITIGFINILALFPAVNGWLLNKYFQTVNDGKILCAFPVIWAFLEWVRSWLFTGFPWLSLGYSQIHTPLKGYADIFSVYGISLVLLLNASLIVNALLYLHKKNNSGMIFQHVFALALLWIIGGALTLVNWTEPHGPKIQVSLIQGNIPQEVKWSPSALEPTLKLYQDLTSAHWDSKMIIWPEGAIPIPLQSAQGYLNAMDRNAKAHDTTIITGIPIQALDREGYYNAVLATGKGDGLYFKHRLVPFGEYIPFEKYLQSVLTSLHIPMSDFISSPRHTIPFAINGIKMSVFICYEIAFPEQVLDKNPDIGLTLTVSNDAWFGHSIAQAQHLQIAEMRALELGRPILFVSNNGITAIIKPNGYLQSSIPPFEVGVLTDTVQPYNGLTPWQRFGLDPWFLIIIGLLLIGIVKRNNRA